MPHLVDEIDALLPQTQCGECQYAGCRPYAQALADGEATPNHCPPGGVETLQALGQLLKIDISAYIDEVDANTRPASIAIINEAECIGCTKCIQACPVDAIIGSAKKMHTVIYDECTGCELCVEPCPVDCIELKTLEKPHFDPDKARQRYQARSLRCGDTIEKPVENKLDYIQQALKRHQARKK